MNGLKIVPFPLIDFLFVGAALAAIKSSRYRDIKNLIAAKAAPTVILKFRSQQPARNRQAVFNGKW